MFLTDGTVTEIILGVRMRPSTVTTKIEGCLKTLSIFLFYSSIGNLSGSNSSVVSCNSTYVFYVISVSTEINLLIAERYPDLNNSVPK